MYIQFIFSYHWSLFKVNCAKISSLNMLKGAKMEDENFSKHLVKFLSLWGMLSILQNNGNGEDINTSL